MSQKLSMKSLMIPLDFVVVMLCLHRQAGCTAEEKLIKVSTNHCVCPGDIVTYECTVVGRSGTTTVWRSDIFQCSSGKRLIELVHRPLTEEEESYVQVCNNGTIVGRIVRIENNSYTSQLSITLMYDIAGNIECIGDNGTNTHRIGLQTLTFTTVIAIPLPPENISWMISYRQQDDYYMIAFKWTTHSFNCHPTYNILASNCGSCPTTTNRTTVTCTDAPINYGACRFAVQTVICGGITGQFSPRISVDILSQEDNVSAQVSGVMLGVVLIVGLTGLATVTIILLIKTKLKVKIGANMLLTVTLDKIPSRKPASVENRSEIITDENVAYAVHSPKTVSAEH